MLQQQAAAGVAQQQPQASAEELEELRGKYSVLEQDLRKTKRAEQKLQALLFRYGRIARDRRHSVAYIEELRTEF